jgi:hypothetical protein
LIHEAWFHTKDATMEIFTADYTDEHGLLK